jgi:hypothetical protein
MWPSKKQVPKVDEVNEKEKALLERLKAAEAFAPIGSFVEYLGVKMMVVKHHKFQATLSGPSFYVPGLKLEWMDNMNRLQELFLKDYRFPLCKVISTPEKTESDI